MKRAILILTLLALAAATGFAQDEPIPPKRSKAVKFGFFGGYTPGWVAVDVAPINLFLQKTPLKDNGILLHGGAGAAYIMFVPNLRVGGLEGGLAGDEEDALLHHHLAVLRHEPPLPGVALGEQPGHHHRETHGEEQREDRAASGRGAPLLGGHG